MENKELAPHQLRVVEEKKELDIKIKNLQVFVEDRLGFISKVSEAEEGDLKHQLHTMYRYSQILKSRINRF